MSPDTAPFVVLLYDMERYAGESRAPHSLYKPGDVRWRLIAYARAEGAQFGSVAWVAPAMSREAALAMVPPGGEYFDRRDNHPSPMVPLEGWAYDRVHAAPEKAA